MESTEETGRGRGANQEAMSEAVPEGEDCKD